MAKKKANHQLSSAEYEKLGRLMVSISEIGFKNKRQLYKLAFIKGLIGGLGGVIGATLLLAVFLYVLSFIGEIPFIGNIADSIKNTIDTSTR